MAKETLQFKINDLVRYLPNNRLYKVLHIDPTPTGTPEAPRYVTLQNDGRFTYTKGELMQVPLALAGTLLGEVKKKPGIVNVEDGGVEKNPPMGQ